MHQRLHLGERPGRATLDQVAGHRERRPGEADQGHTAPGELACNEADGIGDVGKVHCRLEGAETLEVGGAAERLGHDRAPAWLDVHPEPDGVDRHHDVGEQDGGVHAIPAYRLEGQLGRELPVADGLQDRPCAPGRPVLGQGPARLAHEPHRGARDRLAEAGAHKIRVRHRRSAHPSSSGATDLSDTISGRSPAPKTQLPGESFIVAMAMRLIVGGWCCIPCSSSVA